MLAFCNMLVLAVCLLVHNIVDADVWFGVSFELHTQNLTRCWFGELLPGGVDDVVFHQHQPEKLEVL